jgi:AcrR family transcriptional regulator
VVAIKRHKPESSRNAEILEHPDLLADEDLALPPRQQRSLDRRGQLENAALRLFGERGYDATTIGHIADAARVPIGGFYLHFRSKRQLLLSLMNDLLVGLSRLDLSPRSGAHPRAILRDLLTRGFEHDLRYLGAYRAWQEAALGDPDLARKQQTIHAWTTARVAAAFRRLQALPGARADVDVHTLAGVLDSVFWSLLSQAAHTRDAQLERSVAATADLIYHALFLDSGLATSRR